MLWASKVIENTSTAMLTNTNARIFKNAWGFIASDHDLWSITSISIKAETSQMALVSDIKHNGWNRTDAC